MRIASRTAVLGVVLGLLTSNASAYLHPQLGRFMQRDPMRHISGVMEPSSRVPIARDGQVRRRIDAYSIAMRVFGPQPNPYPDGSNLYQFVRSNPLLYVDPAGLEAADPGYTDEYKKGSPEFNDKERELWKQLGFFEKLCMKSAYDIALAVVSGPEYNGTRLNGPGDAVRHCVFSCEMTQCLGGKRAKEWGDAHELNPGPKDEEEMDLANNQQGRDLCPKTNGAGCRASCELAFKEGRLKILPPDRWR
jgi:hypothetical protein